MRRTCVLVILDGWGLGKDKPDNAIMRARTPHWDELWTTRPHRTLQTAGETVGLPPGQMGNSEVGHLNLGAGRVVLQALLKINKDIADGSFQRHPGLGEFMRAALVSDRVLHILGLLSPGGVHSHQEHIFAFCRMAVQRGIRNLKVHAFLDGRDTAPVSATASISLSERLFKELGSGGLGSLCGRYYAMDRDNRWERIERAYGLITRNEAEREAPDAHAGLALARDAGETGGRGKCRRSATAPSPLARPAAPNRTAWRRRPRW